MKKTDEFPAIEAHPNYLGTVDPRKLIPGARHYNAAICRHGKDLVMAYRVEHEDGFSSIAACVLDSKRRPGKSVIVLEADRKAGIQYEDPRLFVHQGELHLSFAEVGVRDGKGAGAAVGLRVLGKGFAPKAAQALQFKANGNGQIQKNWQFFTGHDGKLAFVYLPNPLQIVALDNGKWQSVWTVAANAFSWPLGELHGSTPPVALGADRMLMIVHGSVPHPTRCKRYYAAAMVFDARTSAVMEISAQPWIWASAMTETLPCPRDPRYLPLVVFPSGLVQEPDGSFLLSAGINDSSIAFFRFTLDDLGLVDLAADRKELTATAEKVLTPGFVRVRVLGQPVGEAQGHFTKGQIFTTSTDRAWALGNLVEILGEAS